VDDVVGGFGHRAIAIGGGVGLGVVQRRKAGETPFASDKVSLLVQEQSLSSRPCLVV
jgi:branched-subunit amino acid ABC-type transport system permease component